MDGPQALLQTHLRWPQQPWASKARHATMAITIRVPVMGVPPGRESRGSPADAPSGKPWLKKLDRANRVCFKARRGGIGYSRQPALSGRQSWARGRWAGRGDASWRARRCGHDHRGANRNRFGVDRMVVMLPMAAQAAEQPVMLTVVASHIVSLATRRQSGNQAENHELSHVASPWPGRRSRRLFPPGGTGAEAPRALPFMPTRRRALNPP